MRDFIERRVDKMMRPDPFDSTRYPETKVKLPPVKPYDEACADYDDYLSRQDYTLYNSPADITFETPVFSEPEDLSRFGRFLAKFL